MSSMVHNLLAGMTPREKPLAALMSVTVTIVLVFVVAFLVGDAVTSIEEDIVSYKTAIRLIHEKEGSYRDRLLVDESVKSLGQPKPLRTLVDNVVQRTGVLNPDTKELSDQNLPGGWVEHSMEVTLRDLELDSMVKFMEEVESNRVKFPIAITKLEVRKNRREKSYYTVKLTVSTYEQLSKAESVRPEKGER